MTDILIIIAIFAASLASSFIVARYALNERKRRREIRANYEARAAELAADRRRRRIYQLERELGIGNHGQPLYPERLEFNNNNRKA